MKIIHCADLHLDSRLQTHLDSMEAKNRRAELLHNFTRLTDYAREKGVSAILISGDLFDTRRVSATARNTVLGEMERHPEIAFYYLKGNHDNDDVLYSEDGGLENLYRFGTEWTSYRIPETKIVISGLELSEENSGSMDSSLVLKPDDFNIVLLHGMIGEYAGKKKGDLISLPALKNKNIDYLALGHIHQHQEGVLSQRGSWAYPGCLEGRGMDEAGEHGFLLLDIDIESNQLKKEFIPFAYRRVFEIPVDISGCSRTLDIEKRIRRACEAEGVRDRDYLHIVLTGEVDAESERDLELLRREIAESCYVLKLEDGTSFHVDYTAYAKDASLKGEFVRLVQSQMDISEEEKAEIIRAGILSLRKEEF